MEVSAIGMIGVGSMGGMMTLLFADLGLRVHFYDPSDKMSHDLLESARSSGVSDKVIQEENHVSVYESLPSPKIIFFSIPHGSAGDKSIKSLENCLSEGDIIIDASNEHWQNTERRQRKLEPKGIHYIGMGVSGGYQSARRGPSMSPGGDRDTIEQLLPFLKRAAATDVHDRPCIVNVGPRGSGHYVKMVHNGIEQGMMSILSEVWGIMSHSLGMKYTDIAQEFEKWTKDGPLRENFLLSIGADICRTRNPSDHEYELSKVKDKVVQDVDETEGTGVWTLEEGSRLHISIPTVASAHFFRVTSAYARDRTASTRSFYEGWEQSKIVLTEDKRREFVIALRDSIYSGFLLTFIQGLHLIYKASGTERWSLDMKSLLQLWRGGCIIQSDQIVDVLKTVYESSQLDEENLFANDIVATELGSSISGLKTIVLKALEANAPIPALSASLEYYKYSCSKSLPTQFMEAELDYFGNHKFDLKTDPPGSPVTGKHHFEWKPAKGPHT